MTHAQQLEIAEIAVAGHHFRQHVIPRASPTLLDGVGEIFEQRLRLVEVLLAENGLVCDQGVLPVDQKVTVLYWQTIKVEEHLKWVQIRKICQRLALAAAGELSDHL